MCLRAPTDALRSVQFTRRVFGIRSAAGSRIDPRPAARRRISTSSARFLATSSEPACLSRRGVGTAARPDPTTRRGRRRRCGGSRRRRAYENDDVAPDAVRGLSRRPLARRGVLFIGDAIERRNMREQRRLRFGLLRRRPELRLDLPTPPDAFPRRRPMFHECRLHIQCLRGWNVYAIGVGTTLLVRRGLRVPHLRLRVGRHGVLRLRRGGSPMRASFGRHAVRS
jgi:hypothetical protein